MSFSEEQAEDVCAHIRMYNVHANRYVFTRPPPPKHCGHNYRVAFVGVRPVTPHRRFTPSKDLPEIV